MKMLVWLISACQNVKSTKIKVKRDSFTSKGIWFFQEISICGDEVMKEWHKKKTQERYLCLESLTLWLLFIYRTAGELTPIKSLSTLYLLHVIYCVSVKLHHSIIATHSHFQLVTKFHVRTNLVSLLKAVSAHLVSVCDVQSLSVWWVLATKVS